jgi:hypothetical protein
MNVHQTADVAEFTLPQWSAAEFLDMPVDGLILRALICRLGSGKWQWSIMSVEGESEGRLISAGTEHTVADARLMAASELDKCIREPFA